MKSADQESSPDRAERLKAAGLWKDFGARRAELKAAGMSPKEADAQAAREFAPDKVADSPVEERPQPQLIDPSAWAVHPTPSQREAIMWVASNLDADVAAEDAPSAEAWSLRLWAREHPTAKNAFFTQLYKAILPKPESPDDGRIVWSGDDGEPILQSLLDKVEQTAHEAEREALLKDEQLRNEVRQQIRNEMLNKDEPHQRKDTRW